MTERIKVHERLIRGLLVGVVSAAIALTFWVLNWLEPWEAKTWDWRVRLLAKPGNATDEIRLILLNQSSLDWGEKESKWSWPWPRQIFAEIIHFCQRSGAKALAFDVLFTEFSKYEVEDDVALGTAISNFPHFAGAIFLEDTTSDEEGWPEDVHLPEFTITGLNTWLLTADTKKILFSRASLPIPELTENSTVLCNVNQSPDPDGIYRQVKLFGIFDEKVFPSLGVGAYLAANPEANLAIKSGQFTVGHSIIPIDKQGNAIVRYRGPTSTHKTYTAAKVLQPMFRIFQGEELTTQDKNLFSDFKDKYVLFGFSAPGLKDLRPTPVSGAYSGVEIHATVLDNLLSEDFIRKFPVWLSTMLVIIFALACAILASFFSKPGVNISISALLLAIPVLLSLGFYTAGFWLPLIVQELALITTTVLTLTINYATEGRQKRFIKDAFKHYLSPAVIEQLIQHPEHLKLGGERKIISIFFSDLQGFTSISERLKPEELTALLNEYLSEMTDIIQEEDGTIDKYEGDAIIAFWNAPLNVPDHAIRVVRAALRCQAKLAEMRPAFRERINRDLLMRIGINTGPAVVGNMGSRNRFDYTMLGDAVNLAARLEGANKQFGTYTMISQFTLDLLNETFAARELARIAVVGRQEPVTVYEPVLIRGEYDAKKEIYETFARGLDLFYQGSFSPAFEIFSAIRDQDPAAAAYAEKCSGYMNSPPKEWQGVWVMTTK